jgi:hypothetical protein
MPPDQKVNVNTMTRASFGINAIKYEYESALIYKLQRKKHLESNADNTFAEDAVTSPQLLAIWRAIDKSKISIRTLLIKHSNTITWDEDTLKKLYSMYLALCRDNDVIEDTWMLDDATVLMTTSK